MPRMQADALAPLERLAASAEAGVTKVLSKESRLVVCRANHEQDTSQPRRREGSARI